MRERDRDRERERQTDRQTWRERGSEGGREGERESIFFSCHLASSPSQHYHISGVVYFYYLLLTVQQPVLYVIAGLNTVL